ncbi:MAG: TIGR04255 family protein [Elusimicrobia bacterium]|nr:TIGR04255 family protein [Elusimicrobiota bacterium]
MNKNNIIYPNAPLVEAVFEIKFHGDLTIECHRNKFFNKVRNEYPELFVPLSKEGVSLPLQPYLFKKSDKTASIGLSINSLIINIKKYTGYSSFKTEALKAISCFSKIFPHIKSLKRTGLRYINIIPFTRETGNIPINNYLNIDILLPKSIPSSFKNLSFTFEAQVKKAGVIRTRIESAVSGKSEALILDFDYAKQNSTLNIKSIEKHLDESHKFTKSIFEELITNEYRKIMKNEVL